MDDAGDAVSILYPDSHVKVKRTKAPFPAELFALIEKLEATLSMQGIVLLCARCQQPIHGSNHPSDPTYYLDCPCARRTFDRTRQQQSVRLNEVVQ